MLEASINKHYLDKVITLAEEMPVVATEDIFDAKGNKLLAKGAQVTRSLQEKLTVHKLTKPIEASLSVSGGVDSKLLVRSAERIIDGSQALQSLIAVTQGRGPSPIALLSPLQFGNAMTMMLTIVDRAGEVALDHCVTVAVIAACLAKQANCDQSTQESCVLAGLLHDIGELYVDPVYLSPNRQLEPHEWAHLAVHPKTGQILIEQLESFSKSVSRAVGEHHERLDGTGYPRRLKDIGISQCGQIVAAAEAIAGMMRSDHPLERAELALKLMTREHDRIFLKAISTAKNHLRDVFAEPYCPSRMGEHFSNTVYPRIVEAIEFCASLMQGPGLSVATKTFISGTEERLRQLQRAAISSGLNLELIPEGTDSFDGLLVFEHGGATREIVWRLRDLARDLSLMSATHGERLLMQPLVTLLHPPAEYVDARAA